MTKVTYAIYFGKIRTGKVVATLDEARAICAEAGPKVTYKAEYTEFDPEPKKPYKGKRVLRKLSG